MASKKKSTSKKKAAPKKSNVGGASFNLLSADNESLVDVIHQGLVKTRARRKNQPTTVRSAKDLRINMIPYRHFGLQWLTGCYGIVSQTMVEVLGKTNIGKTTFCMYMMGGAALNNIPAYYQGTENKNPYAEWIMRALAADKELARRILSTITIDDAFVISQMHQQFVDFNNEVRGMGASGKVVVPMDFPVLNILDTFSKLQSNAEANGQVDYGKLMNPDAKKKKKDFGDFNNFSTSKAAHEWARRLAEIMKSRNVTMIVVSHQKDDVGGAMSGGGASFMMTDYTKDLHNVTKIGGTAIDSTSGLQIVMARRRKWVDDAKNHIGHICGMRVHKNSYGPTDRVLEYRIRNDGFRDTETTQTMSIDFDHGLAEVFAKDKFMDTKVNNELYTSPVLGVTNLDAHDFCAAFHENKELVNVAGRYYRIAGYTDMLDEAVNKPEEGADE